MADKFLLLDIKQIRSRYPADIDCFSFVYPPALQFGFGEDMFFQLMLEKQFPGKGYGRFPAETVALLRSQTGRNAWIRASGIKPVQVNLDEMPKWLRAAQPHYSELYKKTLQQMYFYSRRHQRLREQRVSLYQVANRIEGFPRTGYVIPGCGGKVWAESPPPHAPFGDFGRPS